MTSPKTGGGTEPDVGGTSDSPNNGESHGAPSNGGNKSSGGGGGGGGGGGVAAADSAAAAAIPTISLGPLQHDPLYPHLGPAIGRDIACNGLGEFLRTGGAEMPLVDEVGILPGHR